MVADDLSCNTTNAPIRDICLRMTMISPLLDMIKKARVEGLERENYKIERIWGQIPLFVRDGRGLLTRCGKVWVPVSGV